MLASSQSTNKWVSTATSPGHWGPSGSEIQSTQRSENVWWLLTSEHAARPSSLSRVLLALAHMKSCSKKVLICHTHFTILQQPFCSLLERVPVKGSDNGSIFHFNPQMTDSSPCPPRYLQQNDNAVPHMHIHTLSILNNYYALAELIITYYKGETRV